MAQTFSFDIVSRVDRQAVADGVHQAQKEIGQRFDFKGSQSEVRLEEDKIVLVGDDDFKLKQVIDVLETKLVRRGVSLKSLEYGKVEPAAKGTVRQEAKLLAGVPMEKAKTMVKLIKGMGLKLQAQIMDEQVRVFGPKKDELQTVIAYFREHDQGLALQFVNYR
jgi:uncharacterized protein YajQ (UPF0234 family)